ncbi:MAG: hypothetical protein AAGD13_06295 [Pseudomonadota bacterium]
MLRLTLGIALALLAGCDGIRGSDQVGAPEATVKSGDLVDRGLPALTGPQIQIYLKGSTLFHEGSSRAWYVYLNEDGSMVGLSELLDGSGSERATGSWNVTEDDRVCSQWNSDWRGGEFGCATVYREGDVYVFVRADDGSGDELRRQRLAGNPKRL